MLETINLVKRFSSVHIHESLSSLNNNFSNAKGYARLHWTLKSFCEELKTFII